MSGLDDTGQAVRFDHLAVSHVLVTALTTGRLGSAEGRLDRRVRATLPSTEWRTCAILGVLGVPTVAARPGREAPVDRRRIVLGLLPPKPKSFDSVVTAVFSA
jgi:hypothetical protein